MKHNLGKSVLHVACRLAVALCASLVLGACGTAGNLEPPLPVGFIVEVLSYLAPGEDAEFPITVRIRLFMLDEYLPVHSATFDPDAGGPSAPVGVELHAIGKSGPSNRRTSYYFDYEWDGPDDVIATVTVATAGGSFDGATRLRLDTLPPWPY